jgi:Ca-activated chloride channel family protein
MNDQSNYPDALIDRALAELVGGETPPDLTERIIEAAQATTDPVTLAEGPRAMNTVKHSSRLKSWAILSASLACIATVIGLVTPASQEAQDQARLAQRKAENIEQAQKSASGTRHSDGLIMVVTPHIIIQEEEEERLGIAKEESGPADLPNVAPVTPTESIAAPDGKTILLGGLKREPSSEGAGLQSKEAINLESVLRAARSRGGREQQSPEKDGRKSSVTGTTLGPIEPAPVNREKMEALVHQFNQLRDEQRYAEMEIVAKKLHDAAPNEPIAQQVWDNAKFIRRTMLNRELNDRSEGAVVSTKSEGAGQQDFEAKTWQNLSSRSREQESFERGLAKSASTGTTFGFRRSSEPSSGPTAPSSADERNFDMPAEGQQLTDLELSRPGLQAQAPSSGTSILGVPVGDLTSRPARGESLAFDAGAPYFQNSFGLKGQTNNAETLAARVHPVPGLILPIDPQLGTGPEKSGDQYTRIYENPFITAKGGDAVSTFSIDVDTASYANVRQFLTSGQLPPPDAVRIEELVNYFPYDYEGPKDTASTENRPFAAHMEVAACPWNPAHRLARIAIKGREIDRKVRPQSNLVFLVDVSGSMNEPNKLPLLIDGMKLLTRELGENDKVAIVVYASSEGMALPSTRGDQQQTILAALDQLRAGGSTAGGAGINLAYQVAQENFIPGGTNRVILCTDGDFNVGVTDTAALTRLAEEKARDTKVFLTVLGFGRGNLNDAMMESISNRGNGNYHYVDNLTEARKVLVEEMSGTLVTIAKDVKIQVEFNPAQVAGYRLIGYENRMLRTEDFNDDKKDAGEIGAGHTVTALYEIIPAGETVGTPSVDPLKYQPSSLPPGTPGGQQSIKQRGGAANLQASDELLTLKLRYKLPDADTSTKVEYPITDQGGSFADATDDFQFAAAVASFGMLLRNSEHKGNSTFDAVLETAQSALGEDPHGYRGEFLELVRQAKNLRQ